LVGRFQILELEYRLVVDNGDVDGDVDVDDDSVDIRSGVVNGLSYEKIEFRRKSCAA
jgi:hypothetical protein